MNHALLPITVTTPVATETAVLVDTVTITVTSANNPAISAALPLTTRINPSGVDMLYRVYLPLVLRDF